MSNRWAVPNTIRRGGRLGIKVASRSGSLTGSNSSNNVLRKRRIASTSDLIVLPPIKVQVRSAQRSNLKFDPIKCWRGHVCVSAWHPNYHVTAPYSISSSSPASVFSRIDCVLIRRFFLSSAVTVVAESQDFVRVLRSRFDVCVPSSDRLSRRKERTMCKEQVG